VGLPDVYIYCELTSQSATSKIVQEPKIRASTLPITDLVAPPLLFPHLKFQQKRLILGANGMLTPRGMPFERKLEGHIRSDNAVGAIK
jgi:hypothetical protein